MYMYVYLIELLLILFGAIFGFIQNKKYSSHKIKFWYGMVLIFIIISFFMKIYMFLCPSILYLYLFKNTYYLNYLGFFIASFICIFIFSRSNRIKFDYLKATFFLFIILYMIFLYINPIKIELLNQYGYFMSFINSYYEKLFIIIFNICNLFLGAYILTKRYKDKVGGILLIICSILGLINLLVYNSPLFILVFTMSQLFWIITINYSILKLKK